MGGWAYEWMGVKAVFRIANSNKNKSDESAFMLGPAIPALVILAMGSGWLAQLEKRLLAQPVIQV